jgi:hypothetical protein
MKALFKEEIDEEGNDVLNKCSSKNQRIDLGTVASTGKAGGHRGEGCSEGCSKVAATFYIQLSLRQKCSNGCSNPLQTQLTPSRGTEWILLTIM